MNVSTIRENISPLFFSKKLVWYMLFLKKKTKAFKPNICMYIYYN